MAGHIVFVDDDITALDLVSFIFEGRGYKVHRCATGSSALDYAQKFSPDIMVVDLMMPEMNGVETVQAIRAASKTVMPIIAFTAVDEPQLHAEALDAGCNEVLTKPCPVERLVRSIEKYLAPGVVEVM